MIQLPHKLEKALELAEFWGDDLTKWIYHDAQDRIRLRENLEKDFVRTFEKAPKGYRSRNPVTLFESKHDMESLVIKHYLFELNRKNSNHAALQGTIPSSRRGKLSPHLQRYLTSLETPADNENYSPSAEISSPVSEISPSYRLSAL